MLLILFIYYHRANAVFVSATYLIHQTNLIMLTVKDKCEWCGYTWMDSKVQYW